MASSLPPNPKKMFWNKDLVTEISLYLSLPSLFRCRAVCKMWRDVIDSPFFRKHYTHTHTRSSKEEDEDEKVYLQLNYDDFVDNDAKLSIKVVEKGKLLKLSLEGFPSPNLVQREAINGRFWRKFSRPMKGLICVTIIFNGFAQPIVICNPFLGQVKILPFSPNPCKLGLRDVAIGCDGGDGEEFYKVVEMATCREHRRLHAHLYSTRTDSWRDLGRGGGGVLDQEMCILACISSSCNDGLFAHWYTWTPLGTVVLTLDVKNEVFRITRMPEPLCDRYGIVAKDDGFVLVVWPVDTSDEWARIYESSMCEGEDGIGKLRWDHVVNLEQPANLPTPMGLPLWRTGCVMVKILWKRDSLAGVIRDAKAQVKRVVYDCSARRFVGCFELPCFSEFFDYKGTFVSP